MHMGAYGLEMKVHCQYFSLTKDYKPLAFPYWQKMTEQKKFVVSYVFCFLDTFPYFSLFRSSLLLANKYGYLNFGRILDLLRSNFVQHCRHCIRRGVAPTISSPEILEKQCRYVTTSLLFSLGTAFFLAAPSVSRGGLCLPPPLPLPGRDGGTDWVCTV